MGKKKQIENKMGLPQSLKILCILGFLGFAFSMALDTMNYLSFSSIEELKNADDQTAYEQMEDVIEFIQAKGVDVSASGIMRISKMYIFRAILDIIALLGVSMMFVRLKMGYTIYVIGELAYITIPVAMFGIPGAYITGIGGVAITLIYILLFTTQKRHLIK